MTDIPILPEDDDDLLAAEYVLGLLDLATRSQAEIRLRNDPAFLTRVQTWEQHFAGLNDAYAEVQAPNLLPQIEARLFPTPPRRHRFSGLLTWGVTATAAAVLVAYLALTPLSPSFTATLLADSGNLRFDAVITQGTLTITRVAGTGADPSHSHELWLIAGDDPPVSLGILPDTSAIIALPGAALGAILAITEEQPGGSPDGKPHGPIVAKGALTAAT